MHPVARKERSKEHDLYGATIFESQKLRVLEMKLTFQARRELDFIPSSFANLTGETEPLLDRRDSSSRKPALSRLFQLQNQAAERRRDEVLATEELTSDQACLYRAHLGLRAELGSRSLPRRQQQGAAYQKRFLSSLKDSGIQQKTAAGVESRVKIGWMRMQCKG